MVSSPGPFWRGFLPNISCLGPLRQGSAQASKPLKGLAGNSFPWVCVCVFCVFSFCQEWLPSHLAVLDLCNFISLFLVSVFSFCPAKLCRAFQGLNWALGCKSWATTIVLSFCFWCEYAFASKSKEGGSLLGVFGFSRYSLCLDKGTTCT